MNVRPSGIGMTSERTRARMVERLRAAGIRNERVLAVMQEIPRHVFVEEALASRAYEENALPIGLGQTISTPHIVALMTELLCEKCIPAKVLEIGTGCGYQTAVLGRIAKEVYTVERIQPLMDRARRTLRDLRFFNIIFKHADGHFGYPDGGPYQGIIATAASTHIPDELKQQLAPGGRLVIPVGTNEQFLYVVDRTETGFQETRREAVRFVPLLPGVA
ncbi:MAG: protein-L-isoaspartate(D-aspartate) O-methyltransferase [Burkholderiales bacterium]|nr:protein-L-isoaspartate(D-aspartate) O-methyltransferase [Burkholderiales bacterium]